MKPFDHLKASPSHDIAMPHFTSAIPSTEDLEKASSGESKIAVMDHTHRHVTEEEASLPGNSAPDMLQGFQTQGSKLPLSGSLTAKTTNLGNAEEREPSNSEGADESTASFLNTSEWQDPVPQSPEEDGEKSLANAGPQIGLLPTFPSQGASSETPIDRRTGQTSEIQPSVDDLFAGLTFE